MKKNCPDCSGLSFLVDESTFEEYDCPTCAGTGQVNYFPDDPDNARDINEDSKY